MSEVATRQSQSPAIILTRRNVILAVSAVLLAGAAVIVHRQRAVEVELVSPTYEDIESTVSAHGTVLPINDFAARATFAGIVDNVYVHIGEKVRPGQALIEMRDQYADSRVANARVALRTAELNEENLRMNGSKEDRIAEASDLEKAREEQAAAAQALSTVRRLHDVGSTSEAEVTAATQRLQTANAALQAAQQRSQSRYRPDDLKHAQMKIAADRASLAAEKISYGNAHISSPIAGTVYTVPVKQYDFVQMGADLLHVANLKKLAVRAVFYEPDIEQLRSGEPVAITWSGAPGHSWFGNIQTKPLAVSGDGVLRTAECTIEITSDTDGLPINTGVAVAATTNKHSHVLTLPREAVRTEGSRYFVYRVIDSLLKKTEVEIGLVTALKIEVTRGLRTDDRIALHTVGGGVLKDNLHIKAKGQSQLR